VKQVVLSSECGKTSVTLHLFPISLSLSLSLNSSLCHLPHPPQPFLLTHHCKPKILFTLPEPQTSLVKACFTAVVPKIDFVKGTMCTFLGILSKNQYSMIKNQYFYL